MYAIVLLTCCVLHAVTWAQGAHQGDQRKGKGGVSGLKAGVQSGAKEKGARGSSGGGGLTLFKQIDPAKYVLGPGDELLVNLWGEYDAFEPQVVSATGKISLPTIGELKVSGLTLEQAEALLRRAVDKYYRNVNSGISLTSLRTFKVGVLGAVHAPGNYPATLDTRVSDLIVEAGGVLPGGSLRHIQVKQGGTLRAMCDLNAYLKRGVEDANPFLHEGDVIFVPPVSGSLIRIFDQAAVLATTTDGSGAENGSSAPSSTAMLLQYELEAGQRFSSLVYDLGGLNPGWDFSNVYVIRRQPNGEGTVKLQVDLPKLLIEGDEAKDIVLQKGDDVFFAAQVRSPYLNGKGEIVGIERPYYDFNAK
ncbi:polysaccharide biosynthesis/export family protein [Nitrospira sp. Kam-Ns4a]